MIASNNALIKIEHTRRATKSHGQQTVSGGSRGETGQFGYQAQTLFDRQAVGGLLGTAASSFISTSMGEGMFGYLGQTGQNLDTLHRSVGNLAAAGIDMLVGGSTSFNLLGTHDIMAALGMETRGSNTGLLEYRAGGENSGFAIGTGGKTMGITTIMSSVEALEAYKEDSAIKDSNVDEKALVAMRMLYSAGVEGMAEAQELYQSLLSGQTTIELGGTDGKAETKLSEDRKTLHLAAWGDGSRANAVDLGITFAHEAFRDGVVGTQEEQAQETMNAVVGHTQVAMMVEQRYGTEMLSEGVAQETEMFREALRTGDWSGFGEHVSGSYDSSGDYWLLTEDGDIIFDGKKDLYDDEGNLLREFEGKGGYTAALAEHLGISETEANELMVAAGFHSFENGTFVTGDGMNVMNDEQFAVDPGEAFAARYFLQRDYIDSVGDYGGSMTAALNAARDDLMGQVTSGQASGEVFEQLELVDRLTDFGEQYDMTIHGRREGSFGVQGLLNHGAAAAMDQDTIAAAMNHIVASRDTSGTSPFYDYILDGTLDPVIGSTAITARDFYPDNPFTQLLGIANEQHRSRGGVVVDLGLRDESGNPAPSAVRPVVTTQLEFLLTSSSAIEITPAGGLTVQTVLANGGYFSRSAHLVSNSFQDLQLRALQSALRSSTVFRAPLLPGTEIGIVGNTGGLSTGVHYHWNIYGGPNNW